MDIESRSSTFSLVYFSFIRREFNIVADSLTKSATVLNRGELVPVRVQIGYLGFSGISV